MAIIKPVDSIDGLLIYHDTKGKTIYHDIFSNKDYYLEKANFDKYNLYSFRLIASLFICFLLLNTFEFDFFYGVLMGLLFYIGASFLFRFKFLFDLKECFYFLNHDRDNILVKASKEYSIGRTLLIIFLMLIIILWLVYYRSLHVLTIRDNVAYYFLFIVLALTILFFVAAIIAKLFNK